jgi:hypothetical protein
LGAESNEHFGMNKNARKWGVTGAAGAVGLELLLVLVQELLPSESAWREWVHGLVYATVAPVAWAWESLGLLRDGWMLLTIVPFLASVILYLAAIGFLAGVAFSKLRRVP